MMTFTLSPAGAGRRWAEEGHGWRAGPDSVVPFRHPALEASHTTHRNAERFVVRERCSGGDHVELVVTGDGCVRLTAGPGGVAPVYVAVDGGHLVGSWDPADLAGVCGDELCPATVARLLTRRHRYGSETVFAGMARVPAGATVSWTRSGDLTVRYPPPAQHVVRPRPLRPGADPVDAFTALFDSVVGDRVVGQVDPVAVEVSGGLDSANVAVSAASAPGTTLVAGGLVVHGAQGRAQRRRRRAIVDHLRIPDEHVVARDHLPLAVDGPRTPGRPHYPDGDVYREAFDELRFRFRTAGARIVVTGHGGDEIMRRTPAECGNPGGLPPALPAWISDRTRDAVRHIDRRCSPVTAVALPTLLVFAARHPAYLRAGLWPVAPFAHPEVSRFARSLPVEWRTAKLLLRDRLTRLGLPGAVTRPRRPESFTATMRFALRSHAPGLLDDMLDRSVLIDQGYVRRGPVEWLRRDARWGRALPPMVYDMLALDIGVRSMTTAHRRTEEPHR